MKKKWVAGTVITILACAGVAVIARLRSTSAKSGPEYLTAPVERGEILTTITSSGTLDPVATVDVGTQVSGIIDRIYVDFNDTVEKGQLIAELDRTFLAGALDEALASRNRARALYDLAEAEYRRNEPLYKKGFLSEQEFTKIRTDYLSQQATLQSAEASVKKARINLQYATITSPIKGTVIQRNIEVGQTVAASFSAPTLFVIAEDLRRMQILASVDEADIGEIHRLQEVRFTVQAFPDRNFLGVVEQVRLQPTVEQNVVTYTVVIETDNKDGLLLPGMTATVDFVVAKAENALLVPNAALRFRPQQDTLRKVPGGSGKSGRTGERQRDRRKNLDADGKPVPVNGDGDARGHPALLWVLSGEKMPLQPLRVRTGITDGKMTVILTADAISEGTEVITGVKSGRKQEKREITLLPQPGRPGRRR